MEGIEASLRLITKHEEEYTLLQVLPPNSDEYKAVL